jgi:hypothetical protein
MHSFAMQRQAGCELRRPFILITATIVAFALLWHASLRTAAVTRGGVNVVARAAFLILTCVGCIATLSPAGGSHYQRTDRRRILGWIARDRRRARRHGAIGRASQPHRDARIRRRPDDVARKDATAGVSEAAIVSLSRARLLAASQFEAATPTYDAPAR